MATSVTNIAPFESRSSWSDDLRSDPGSFKERLVNTEEVLLTVDGDLGGLAALDSDRRGVRDHGIGSLSCHHCREQRDYQTRSEGSHEQPQNYVETPPPP